MSNNLHQQLLTYKKRTITISVLEEMIGRSARTYSSFAGEILQLEVEGILHMVKAKGRNSRTLSLAYHYKINKSLLNREPSGTTKSASK